MQIEFSPLMGVMVGMNYAYYEATDEYEGLHLVQIGIGLIMVQMSWGT
jgi:hypothetical protein